MGCYDIILVGLALILCLVVCLSAGMLLFAALRAIRALEGTVTKLTEVATEAIQSFVAAYNLEAKVYLDAKREEESADNKEERPIGPIDLT